MNDASYPTPSEESLAMLRTTHLYPHDEAVYCVKVEGDSGYEVGCDLCGWWRNMVPKRWQAYWFLFRHECKGADCERL